MTPPRARPHTRRRSARATRPLAAGIVGLAVALPIAIASLDGGSGGGASPTPRGGSHAGVPPATPTLRVTVARTGDLPSPVQDAAAVPFGSERLLLLGGLAQSETSVGDIVSATSTHSALIGRLPTALHDASASNLGGVVYLFGGGAVASFPTITRLDASGEAHSAGRLPTAASDVATTVVNGTVYVVGGYTGVAPLRTILSWRPHQAARVLATLPKPLRYAAVTSVGGQVVIAGGTSGEVASRDIYRFDPTTLALTKLGLLPHPLTHSTAASIGSTALLFGGRGAPSTSQTSRILAIAPNGKVTTAGRLPRPLSDLGAVAIGGKVVLVGGRDPGGRVQDSILTATPTAP